MHNVHTCYLWTRHTDDVGLGRRAESFKRSFPPASGVMLGSEPAGEPYIVPDFPPSPTMDIRF
ncbi:hypothetical protein PHLCEN_2v679 [Hermanssonia centrifuga]|uniref:Uncharacterized protein n=1 Tax=Hermanssonia centrifuga TaxID=98765 RepID=A0A2R6S5E1_9APHY|nr:hypothetical protein PHLCEN_2v679 [Hermanssonia centrifuga]